MFASIWRCLLDRIEDGDPKHLGLKANENEVVSKIEEDGEVLMLLGLVHTKQQYFAWLYILDIDSTHLLLLLLAIRLETSLRYDREGGIRQLEAIQNQMLYNFGEASFEQSQE